MNKHFTKSVAPFLYFSSQAISCQISNFIADKAYMESITQKFQLFITKVGEDNAAYFCWCVASILSALSFIYPN